MSADQARCDMDGEAVGVLPAAPAERDGPPPLPAEFRHGCYYVAVMFIALAGWAIAMHLADGAGWLK